MIRRLFRRQKRLLSSIVIICAFVATLSPLLVLELSKRPQIYRSLIARWQGAEYLGEVGVIRQSTPYDCGVACLQMVFIQQGRSATAATIRSFSGTGARGTSLLGLKIAAKKHGLPASVWKLREIDLLNAPLPLIAFVDNSHFVVVSSITPDKHLIVMDPSAGKLKYSLNSFMDRWRGEVVLFSDFKIGK